MVVNYFGQVSSCLEKFGTILDSFLPFGQILSDLGHFFSHSGQVILDSILEFLEVSLLSFRTSYCFSACIP